MRGTHRKLNQSFAQTTGINKGHEFKKLKSVAKFMKKELFEKDTCEIFPWELMYLAEIGRYVIA